MNKSPLRWDCRQVVGVTQWGPTGPVDVVEPLAVWNHGQLVGEGQGSGNHARPVPPPDTSGGFSGFGATWDGSGLRWATGYRLTGPTSSRSRASGSARSRRSPESDVRSGALLAGPHCSPVHRDRTSALAGARPTRAI